ncbi:MAG: glycine cleavage system protein GcvH [Pseudomonadota bacterium]
MFPKYLRYSKEHEWARWDEEEGVVLVGITDYAQEKIGDITYVELPEEEDLVEKSKPFAEIEHSKGVEDIYSPVTGKVVEVNEVLGDSPEVINEDPYDEGWLVKIEPDDPGEIDDLMDADEYETYVSELEEGE